MFTPEMLETRRLLSVSVRLDDALGTLYVVGDEAANNVRIVTTPSQAKPAVATKPRGASLDRSASLAGPMISGLAVYQDSQLLFHSTNTLNTIQQVVVSGGGGDDNLAAVLNTTNVAVQLEGDAGDDTLDASTFQSAGPVLLGGDGNDIISSTYGDTATLNLVDGGAGLDWIILTNDVGAIPAGAVSVFGGEDNDLFQLIAATDAPGFVVSGGPGNDWIVGSTSSDSLFGDDGDDSLYGGDGDDFLDGGRGNDMLYGWGGDDFLIGGEGRDFLDGGEGHDTAVIDLDDVVNNIEIVPKA